MLDRVLVCFYSVAGLLQSCSLQPIGACQTVIDWHGTLRLGSSACSKIVCLKMQHRRQNGTLKTSATMKSASLTKTVSYS